LRRIQVELHGNERQSYTCHEDDHAFEEFPCRCKPPDAPLHPSHRYCRYHRTIGPVGALIEVFLDCLRGWFSGHAYSSTRHSRQELQRNRYLSLLLCLVEVPGLFFSYCSLRPPIMACTWLWV